MHIAIAAGALAMLGVASAALASPKSDDTKRICRDLDVTGSIMTKRVCHTRGEWKGIDAVAERKMDDRSNNASIDRSQGTDTPGTDSFGQK